MYPPLVKSNLRLLLHSLGCLGRLYLSAHAPGPCDRLLPSSSDKWHHP